MPVCSRVCHAINAIIPLPGARLHSTCYIQAAAVIVAASTIREQPVVIATPLTYPRQPALNAIPATIPAMGEAAKKQLYIEYQGIYLDVDVIFLEVYSSR
jgi:hypothetical protein